MLLRKTNDTEASTRERILDIAERLAQVRGYNGFSFADIAAELQVTKASLHYHFPGKADLGLALIVRYTGSFDAALRGIEGSARTVPKKLERYVQLYAGVLRGDRMCLCGMLAAEQATLPAPMQDALRGFFDMNERWLSGVLEAGRAQGVLEFDGPASAVARLLVGTLEGEMMVARLYGEPARFTATAKRLLGSIGTR